MWGQAGVNGTVDVSSVIAQLDSSQSDLEAGNGALIRQHVRVVALLAEDAISLSGAAQASPALLSPSPQISLRCRIHSKWKAPEYVVSLSTSPSDVPGHSALK